MTRVNAWSDAVQFLFSLRRTLHDVNAVVRYRSQSRTPFLN
jgi:hypothetical protein